MDEDEEIRSPVSSPTGSPMSSRRNGRITVTVASIPPNQKTLTLALPIQQPRNVSGGGGREDCWSEGATGVLIEAWGERYLELSRGNLKQKHWKEVADVVSSRDEYSKTLKTDVQCKNRIDTVKKKYKLEKAKITGGRSSNWAFYKTLDHLIGSTAKVTASSPSPSVHARKIPMRIPLGTRAVNQYREQQKQILQNQKRKAQPQEQDTTASSSSDPDNTFRNSRKKARVEIQRELSSKGDYKWGNSMREFTRAIVRFGEIYEKCESSKLQQMVEMEKQKMKFAKEMELQRMQFFMKTQVEISQMKESQRRKKGGHSSNHGGK